MSRKTGSIFERKLRAYASENEAIRHLTRRSGRVLAGCLLTAGAACAAGGQAQAAILYHNEIPDFVVSSGAGHVQRYISMSGGNKFRIKYWDGSWQSLTIHPVTTKASVARQVAGVARYFAEGATIGASAVWEHAFSDLLASRSGGGQFEGLTGFIGVRFDAARATKYGWIQFEGAADGMSGIIHGWATQSDGSAIVTSGEAQ